MKHNQKKDRKTNFNESGAAYNLFFNSTKTGRPARINNRKIIMNKTIVTARLVKDAEFKSVGESTVINFVVANNDNCYKDEKSGEWVNKTVYFHCIMWSRSQSQLEFLRNCLIKGKYLLLEGSVELQVFITKEKTAGGKIVLHVNSLDPFN